jgi:hypothetical protein
MEFLPGFKLDFWDFATAVVLFMRVITGLAFVIWLAGQLGRIAITRKYPDAEAVMLMGYAVSCRWCRGSRRSSGRLSPPIW